MKTFTFMFIFFKYYINVHSFEKKNNFVYKKMNLCLPVHPYVNLTVYILYAHLKFLGNVLPGTFVKYVPPV